MANEKVNYKLDLANGTYILIFHDSYGDGGVRNINFLNSGKELSILYLKCIEKVLNLKLIVMMI